MTAVSRQPSAARCQSAVASCRLQVTEGWKAETWNLKPETVAGRREGFTLVEVLVALAIVAVALLAGLRAVGTMAQSGTELKLRLLAQVAAENRVAELRAARAFPGIGARTIPCPQGRMPFECVEETKATPNPMFRRIEVSVYAGRERDHRLAELVGILPNEQ
jgi:general secretion pathway protein I